MINHSPPTVQPAVMMHRSPRLYRSAAALASSCLHRLSIQVQNSSASTRQALVTGTRQEARRPRLTGGRPGERTYYYNVAVWLWHGEAPAQE